MSKAEAGLALISGILAIIHPTQYDMARKVKDNILKTSRCTRTLNRWGTVLTAITIISNRWTPAHRDNASRVQWYDLLTSLGTYGTASLHIRLLGIRIPNSPGTLSAFSGMAFSHTVDEIEQARVSLALYSRENVRAGADVEPAPWMSQKYYESLVGPNRHELRCRRKEVTKAEMDDLVNCLQTSQLGM